MKKHVEPTFDFESLTAKEAAAALADNLVSLTVEEAKYFQRELGRPLTLTELTVLGIQGSEHCSYRSTRQHLGKLPTKGPKVMIGPGEDAGIVEIAREKNGKKWGLVVGHESHNHPSQIVPYEGAATGVGGIVRDIVCMGARVIGALDCLRFGSFSKPFNRQLTREVVRGIAGYGNPLGVPNLGGDIEFDESFDRNCLVNVVAAGVVAEDEIIHSYAPKEAAKVGYDIIIVGKPTDRSGFGGASFASGELKEEDAEKNKGAVQEPNPFLERHILAATYDLFRELKKRKLLDKVSFKDHGAGGNVCATVEQLDRWNFGAEIDLAKIHVDGEHPPHVIACAETQERFCWVVHPKVTKLILDFYNKKWDLPSVAKNARASVVGKVKKGNYVLKFRGATLVDAPAKVLTEGLRYDRAFKSKKKKFKKTKLVRIDELAILKKILGSPNVASREAIFEKYDKQVQGATAIDAGCGASAILRPLTNTTASRDLKKIGVTIGVGGNASLGKFDAKTQAQHAVAEAIANVVSVGATPLALTDCLNFGNPEKPDQMAEFVEAIDGLSAAATEFKTPFVSGNVSLYNENGNVSINPSALVAAIGRLDDAADALPQTFQKTNSILVLVGERASNLGGSEFERALSKPLGEAFSINLPKFKTESDFVLTAAQKNLVESCRDLHRGGLISTAAEMTFGTEFGVKLKAAAVEKLFAENPGYLLEVAPENLPKLKKLAATKKIKIVEIGRVTTDGTFALGKNETKKSALEKVWRDGFRKKWIK